MKQNLKTALYIVTFAIAGILFQISCSNSDETAINVIDEKFVFVKKKFGDAGQQSIWIANFDGTEMTEIPITLPPDMALYTIYSSGEHSSVRLSQDEQRILFTVQKNGSNETYIYSCNVDGTNLQEIAEFDSSDGIFIY